MCGASESDLTAAFAVGLVAMLGFIVSSCVQCCGASHVCCRPCCPKLSNEDENTRIRCGSIGVAVSLSILVIWAIICLASLDYRTNYYVPLILFVCVFLSSSFLSFCV